MGKTIKKEQPPLFRVTYNTLSGSELHEDCDTLKSAKDSAKQLAKSQACYNAGGFVVVVWQRIKSPSGPMWSEVKSYYK